MGGHHHNGISDNVINNVFRISRTMMIHDALRWHDSSEKKLWPMDMDRAINLHNHNTHIYSGMSPEEVFTSSKSSPLLEK